MLSFLLLVLTCGCLLKCTDFMFRLFGKLLGFVFGAIGYVIVGALAITVLGFATIVGPIVIVAGIISVIALIARLSSKAV